MARITVLTPCHHLTRLEYNDVEAGSTTACDVCEATFRWKHDKNRRLLPVGGVLLKEPTRLSTGGQSNA